MRAGMLARESGSGGSWGNSGTRGWGVVALAVAVSCAVGYLIATGSMAALGIVLILLMFAGVSMFDSVPKVPVLIWLAFAPLFLPFLRFPRSGSAAFTFDRFFLLGMGVLCLGALVNLSGASLETRRLVRWFLVLSAVVLVRGLLGTVGGTSGLKVLLDAFILPLLALLLVRGSIETQADVDRSLLAFSIGGALIGLVAIAEWRLGFSLASLAGGTERIDHDASTVRIAGTYSVPEVSAAVLLCTLSATLAWARRAPGRNRLAGAMVLAQFSGIFLTYFRTGWAAAFLIVVGSFVMRKGEGTKVVVAGIATAAILMFGAGQLASGGQSVVQKRLSNSANTYARLAAYKQGIQMISRSPLLGVGLGGYPEVSVTMAPTFVNGVKNVIHPHNSLIQIGAETGLFGLLAWIGVVIAAARMLWNYWRRSAVWLDERLAAAGILGFSAYLFFGLPFSMLPYGSVTSAVFVLLGLCSARLDALPEE